MVGGSIPSLGANRAVAQLAARAAGSREVAGSRPARPDHLAVAQSGSARGPDPRGRGCKSSLSDQSSQRTGEPADRRLGSNPSEMCVRLVPPVPSLVGPSFNGRTPGLHPGNGGSIPLVSTNRVVV